jgi:MoaA/NifB/PqqE/SkfB family radical SAM enzyme
VSALAETPDHIPLAVQFNQVLFLLTNKCNLTCRHCYVASSPTGSHGLDADVVLRFIEEAHDMFGPIQFALSGGEALVRRDDALKILSAASKHFPTWLLTNGTLLDPNTCRHLRDMGIHIRLSLDGGSERTHNLMRGRTAYQRLVRGMKNLAAIDYPERKITIFSTVAPENVVEIGAILRLAESHHIRQVKFEPICKTGRALENWAGRPGKTPDPDSDNYLEYFKHSFEELHGKRWDLVDLQPQELSWRTINVYFDGAVYPYTYTNSADQEVGRLGNINSERLRDILSADRVSRAVVSKLIMFSRHPRRSLHAYVARAK